MFGHPHRQELLRAARGGGGGMGWVDLGCMVAHGMVAPLRCRSSFKVPSAHQHQLAD
jgi:hypothetical protein